MAGGMGLFVPPHPSLLILKGRGESGWLFSMSWRWGGRGGVAGGGCRGVVDGEGVSVDDWGEALPCLGYTILQCLSSRL